MTMQVEMYKMEQIASNKLYHDEKKNIVKGRTNTSYSQRVNPYKLSQVRKNKVKVQPKPKPKRK